MLNTSGKGQSLNPPSEEIPVELQTLVEETAVEEDTELEILEFWEELRENPVSLNRAGLVELLRIPAMRPAYAKAILDYRRMQGAFGSLAELSRVPGLPGPVAERILPYVTLGSVGDRLADSWANPRYWLAGLKAESVTRMRVTMERPDGFRPDQEGKSSYGENRADKYQRVKIRSKHLSAGATWRSGIGTTGTWVKPDLGSVHLNITDIVGLDALAVGDYRIRYGMGLSMNSGYAPRKGFMLVDPRMSTRTVSPFTGSSYSGHFKGIAGTWGQRIQTSAWISDRRYTASAGEGDSLRWSTAEPYFRTQSERDKRDNLRVLMVGGRVLGSWKTGWMGASAWKARTSSPLGKGNGLNRSDPIGRHFNMLSADFRQDVGIFSVSGEMAVDHRHRSAAMLMVESSPAEALDHVMILRRYSSGFQSLFGRAFSAWSGAPSNELGMYTGWRYRPDRKAELLLYADFFRSIKPRPDATMPQGGAEGGARAQFVWKACSLAVAMKKRAWHEWERSEDDVGREYLARIRLARSHIRAEIGSDIDRKWTIKTRAEWVQFSPLNLSPESGTMVFQEVRWKAGRRWGLQARVCLFRTDGYDTRLVAYEPDVALISGSFGMQGEGSRQFVVASFRPWPWGEFQFKWAQTKIYGAHEIGSGNDRIVGDTKTFINGSLSVKL